MLDPIATLLLARTHTVVLDADSVTSAATRPARDADVDRFEDELLQLGFVLSLDLAMTLRRLPYQALGELRAWILDTLGKLRPRPDVPLAPDDTRERYARRVAAWLASRREQPCPWCGKLAHVGALDPCGHLACKHCWSGGAYAGCAVCHRRVAVAQPFFTWENAAPVTGCDGALQLLHLGLDATAVAQGRVMRLLGGVLSADERVELEHLIDALGPKVAQWLPKRIAARETMAIVVARLWLVAPDRIAMMQSTIGHVHDATDVLRIAAVLMSGTPFLGGPLRFQSIPRSLRRAVLGALEQLPPADLLDELHRHEALWKRAGERLHPGELALPNVKAAFAALRGRATHATWGGRLEGALAAGDARTAAALLAQRPAELLRRFDHLVRVTVARQPDAIDDVLAALGDAAARGAPDALLALAAHIATRPFAPALVDAITQILRGALATRAAARRHFARAVIDRGLGDVVLRPTGHARPTLWDVVALHAAARANTIYVRDEAGVTIYKRRDGESDLARIARIFAGTHDGTCRIPPANAPTWFAVVREDLALPKASEGFVLDDSSVRAQAVIRLTAADLIAELA
ncbi:MAG TPA: RING finger family 4 domain-containing protein [Kofleriaceae bacterium]|nr:RING finger family 4 domain-containing protein [Kofleriaceae bacterium]